MVGRPVPMRPASANSLRRGRSSCAQLRVVKFIRAAAANSPAQGRRRRRLPGLAAPEGRHSADPQAAFGHHPFQSQSQNYLRITVWLNVRLTVASSAQASPIANARRGFARRTSRRPRQSDCFRLSASAISFSGGFVPHITCDKCMQSRCECGSSFSNQNRDTDAMNEL